ncbi:MAG: Cell shape-determining protein MreC [Deltaproteobacteria bacterium]|nr:Cell shape-determining protein MreC [Deltaproteobacteria bacterium]
MLLKFVKRNKVNVTFLSLLIVSILQMSMDAKKRGKLSMLDELLLDSASIAQRGITTSYQATTDAWFGYIYLIGLKEENRLLRDETSELRGRINALKEAIQENQRLKDLLSFKETTEYGTTTARVIGVSPLRSFKTIIISKGSIDGVRKDMAVVTKDGVIGRILSTAANTSKVLLITDRNSDVDALIQRSRDRGIAEGGDSALIQLKYLSKNADAVVGDLVVTSGIGGVFKKGCIIGAISRVDKKAGLMFHYVEIEPSVNFSKLEEVLVITDSHEENGR